MELFNINFSNIEKRVKNFLDSAFNSSMINKVTYKKFESETYDEATGKSTTSYSEYELDVVRSDTALEAQKASTILSAVGFSGGEMLMIAKYDDVPRDPYSKDIMKDFIIDGNNEEYTIKKAVPLFTSFIIIQI